MSVAVPLCSTNWIRFDKNSNKNNEAFQTPDSLTLSLKPSKDSLANCCYLNDMYVTYQSLEDDAIKDFFKRLNYICVIDTTETEPDSEEQKEIFQLHGSVWSSLLVLQQRNLIKNKKDSTLFIPLPAPALFNRTITQDGFLKVVFHFNKYQQEEHRIGLYVSLHTHPVQSATGDQRWQFSAPIVHPLPTHEIKDTEVIQIPIPIQNNYKLAQLVFHIPGAGAWIDKAKLVARAPDHYEDDVVVAQFEDPYHAVVVEKVITGFEVPKQPLFTMTLCNWLNLSPVWGMSCKEIESLTLHLYLNNLPVDNRPKQPQFEGFLVYSEERVLPGGLLF